MTKWRAHQILQREVERSGVQKPPRVGAVHVLRHSGALERLGPLDGQDDPALYEDPDGRGSVEDYDAFRGADDGCLES